MTAPDFRAALRAMNLNQTEAADVLGVSAPQRINEWAKGRQSVPPYIAASVRAHLALYNCRERRGAT